MSEERRMEVKWGIWVSFIEIWWGRRVWLK